MHENLSSLAIYSDHEVKALSPSIDAIGAMRKMFASLANGTALQPPQQQIGLANGGDFINYLGVLNEEQVYGLKTSPYIPTQNKPIVTAWTMLMSSKSGLPIMLTDAGYLTIQRTAATTALAVEHLAKKDAKRLAIIGTGPIALAHLKYARSLREWERISIFSPNLGAMDEASRQEIERLDERVLLCELQSKALVKADVILLCTSSAKPVIELSQLGNTALITSISTNAPKAHEVSPSDLKKMDVYCDYRKTTPDTAGEMIIARENSQWNASMLAGDLCELVLGKAKLPDYKRNVFFRSVGLGLEDVAIAMELYSLHQQQAASAT
ncbi:ornithine cyclodeaminase family protein [Pseudomonas mosselii]|uniref:ornithine cyclodeaminase family protein n=1 Tax=Pseudomonas mosselii TaxID=78327 RepID=UPI0016449161|nr:ornithine cyclodeaminase family protein [Pseudomonas mosselii]MBC3456947.1 ornithine cyclodeaminase family protein [Pseudomonas mosselii]